MPENTLFFDIETLGLSSEYCPIYLIGCMYIRKRSPVIKLIFSENSSNEEEIILEFTKLISSFDSYLTFNGTTFDIPYLEARAKKYGIDFSINKDNHLDLLKRVKSLKNLLGLSNCKQKTIEGFLGIERDDKYNGGELIKVYKEFEKTGDNDLKELLILHNLEDVKGMGGILPILEFESLMRGEFKITDYYFEDESLYFSGDLNATLPTSLTMERPGIHVVFRDRRFSGVLKLYRGRFKLFMENFKDYVYLPQEDMIIPKELSTGIDKAKKTPATRENAYTWVEGLFMVVNPENIGKRNKVKSLLNKFKNCHICKSELLDPVFYIYLGKKESPGFPELSDRIFDLLYSTFS